MQRIEEFDYVAVFRMLLDLRSVQLQLLASILDHGSRQKIHSQGGISIF